MSCVGNASDINQTFIIEPLSITASTIVSACTALYANNLISCSGDTQILLDTGFISVNGSIYTNSNLSASTIYGSIFYSGGTDLYTVIDTFSISGGSFNPYNKIVTYKRKNNSSFNLLLPVRTFISNTATTSSNVLLQIDSITGITNNSNSFIISYVNAYKDNQDYGFWKRTLAINKVSGIVSIIGENADFDRISSGLTSNSVVYSANSGNVLISISGETSKNYNWSSNWEIIF